MENAKTARKSKTQASFRQLGALFLAFVLLGTANLNAQSSVNTPGDENAPPKFSVASPVFLGLGTLSLGVGTALWFTGDQNDSQLITGGIMAGVGAVSLLVGFLTGTMELDLERVDPAPYVREGNQGPESGERSALQTPNGAQNQLGALRINPYLRANEVGIRIK